MSKFLESSLDIVGSVIGLQSFKKEFYNKDCKCDNL